mgnify:CR=1 FL=1
MSQASLFLTLLGLRCPGILDCFLQSLRAVKEEFAPLPMLPVFRQVLPEAVSAGVRVSLVHVVALYHLESRCDFQAKGSSRMPCLG